MIKNQHGKYRFQNESEVLNSFGYENVKYFDIDYFSIKYFFINVNFSLAKFFRVLPKYKYAYDNHVYDTDKNSVYHYIRRDGSSALRWGSIPWEPSIRLKSSILEKTKFFDTNFNMNNQKTQIESIEALKVVIKKLNENNIETILVNVPFSNFVLESCKIDIPNHNFCKDLEDFKKILHEISIETNSKVLCNFDHEKNKIEYGDLMDWYHITEKGFSKCKLEIKK